MQICSHLLKKSLTENFIFSAVRGALVQNGLMRSGNGLVKRMKLLFAIEFLKKD